LHFPATHWELVRAQDERGVERLIRIYWNPAYSYLRQRWKLSREDAEDVTQEFFAGLWQKAWLSRVDRNKGRFRSFLMACLDNAARHSRRTEHRRQKRVRSGLGSLSEEVSDPWMPDDALEGERERALLQMALAQLRLEYEAAGRGRAFDLFLFRDFPPNPDQDVRYESLAERFCMTMSEVALSLHRSRRRLGELMQGGKNT